MTTICHACEHSFDHDDPGINTDSLPCPACGVPVRITAVARAAASQRARAAAPASNTITLSPSSTWIIARGVFYALLVWSVLAFFAWLILGAVASVLRRV